MQTPARNKARQPCHDAAETLRLYGIGTAAWRCNCGAVPACRIFGNNVNVWRPVFGPQAQIAAPAAPVAWAPGF